MEYNTLNIEHNYTPDYDDAEYMIEDEEVDESVGKSEDINDIKNENYDSEDLKQFSESSSNVKNTKNIRIWTNKECSKRLLELYNDLNPKIGRSGQFTKKKQMFEYIAKKIYEEFGERYTGQQVASRSKNIFRGKTKFMRKVKVQNNLKMPVTETESTKIDISNYNLESMYDDDNGVEDFVTEYEDDEPVTHSSKANFTNQQSRKLLRLYNMFIPNIGSNQQFKTKKDVWEAISEEIFHEFGVKYSPLQCDSRYKTIVRKAKRLLLRGELKLKTKEKSKELTKNLNENSRENACKASNGKKTYISDNEYNQLYEDDNQSNFYKNEVNEDDDSYEDSYNNSVQNKQKNRKSNNCRLAQKNSFDQKFYDKELMKKYIEYKERKAKKEQNRHNEIMEQLHKINQTLLEIKCQGNVYKKS